jgi:hypothetical protein
MNIDKFGADDICVKAYDPEKKELIAVYDNFSQASRKLGISVKAIYAACASKSRRFSPFLNKEVALRSAAKVQKSGV